MEAATASGGHGRWQHWQHAARRAENCGFEKRDGAFYAASTAPCGRRAALRVGSSGGPSCFGAPAPSHPPRAPSRLPSASQLPLAACRCAALCLLPVSCARCCSEAVLARAAACDTDAASAAARCPRPRPPSPRAHREPLRRLSSPPSLRVPARASARPRPPAPPRPRRPQRRPQRRCPPSAPVWPPAWPLPALVLRCAGAARHLVSLAPSAALAVAVSGRLAAQRAHFRPRAGSLRARHVRCGCTRRESRPRPRPPRSRLPLALHVPSHRACSAPSTALPSPALPSSAPVLLPALPSAHCDSRLPPPTRRLPRAASPSSPSPLRGTHPDARDQCTLGAAAYAATMEHGACNVIYVDRRVNDEHVKRETLSDSLIARTSTGNVGQSYFALGKAPPVEVHTNVEAILSVFNEVHICGSGRSCLAKITQLVDGTKPNIPTFVILDVPYDEELRLKRLSREPRTPSPTSSRVLRVDNNEPDDTYGTHLLTHVSSEILSRNFSKLVVPIVMLTGLAVETPSVAAPSSLNKTLVLTDTVKLSKYLDSGAVDVLSSPLSKDRIHGLAVHAYRLQKEAQREEASFLTTKRNRKLSWVGVDDAKPYAYLREAMVSNLMTGICNPETFGDSWDASDFELDEQRRRMVEDKVATWAFSAHDFTDDELLYAALVMLEHALSSPELSQWQLTEDELIVFLMASRAAYNEFVKYHNFRHVIDVLQALFHFLVRIGTLPSFPPTDKDPSTEKSPIAALLKPFDALTLLISAIGHDVGHPGVNNAFLVALNAPLAQLYNDRSVLESFHCAAYSQILRRYWPKIFSDTAMRKLMINNILATDMGLHFTYMSQLGSLQEKIAHDKGVTDGWSVKVREEHKDLTCGLLIKCADICNVARKFETAAKWADVLTDEFSNQGLMEEELQMPSCLFGGPPVQDDLIKLGESQIGFMNIFARPLFEAVTDILPAMRFAVDEILTNKAIWDSKIDQEKKRRKSKPPMHLGLLQASFAPDPTPSPFSSGPNKPNATVFAPLTVEEESGRRGSNGSVPGGIQGSRRSSAAVALASRENQSSSRRGSGDANLTAILVTHTPNAGDGTPRASDVGVEDRLKGDRKDTLTRSTSKKKDRDNGRPVTAPAPARRSQVVELFPVQQSSPQSHSEVDLSQGANGNLEGSKLQQWESNKMSGESGATRSDLSRDSSWWRQMSSKRRTTRDTRNGDLEAPYPPKEPMLNIPTSHPDPNVYSGTGMSPGRKHTAGRFKSFFKRKPKGQEEQGKQLSSFGSSSQLRTTPPTSDQGRSLNGDD